MANTTKKWSGLAISKTLLFRTLTYRAAGFLGKPLLLFKVAQKALHKADKDSSFKGVAQNALDSLKQLVRMVTAYASGSYDGISRKNLILVVAAILYFISPLDVIPDVIPVIGFLDDITLIGWVLKTLGEELSKFEEYEQQNSQGLLSLSYQDLYERAKAQNVAGRAGMSRQELAEALGA